MNMCYATPSPHRATNEWVASFGSAACEAFIRVLLAIIAITFVNPSLADEGPRLTFFGWSDQHVQTSGDGQHLVPAIDAMNQLPGKRFPDSIGGQVEKPAFVFGCGDITEWPTHAAMKTYDQLIRTRLAFPAYDAIGNHDEGGKAPSDTIKNWLRRRYGGLSYTFQAGGVCLIVVYSKYDESLNSPAQPLTADALEYVRGELAKLPKGAPAIVATHLCFDAMTNRDALVDVLDGHNVIAILGGHYHKSKVDPYRGRHFIQLPSPAPGSPSEVMVVRITPQRIVAIAYDYDKRRWATDPRKILDTSLVVTNTGK